MQVTHSRAFLPVTPLCCQFGRICTVVWSRPPAKASAAPELSKTCLGVLAVHPAARLQPSCLFIANPITFATTTIFDTSSLFTSTQLSRPLILSRIYLYSLYSDQRNHVCHRQRRVSLFLYYLATPPNPIHC